MQRIFSPCSFYYPPWKNNFFTLLDNFFLEMGQVFDANCGNTPGKPATAKWHKWTYSGNFTVRSLWPHLKNVHHVKIHADEAALKKCRKEFHNPFEIAPTQAVLCVCLPWVLLASCPVLARSFSPSFKFFLLAHAFSSILTLVKCRGKQ